MYNSPCAKPEPDIVSSPPPLTELSCGLTNHVGDDAACPQVNDMNKCNAIVITILVLLKEDHGCWYAIALNNQIFVREILILIVSPRFEQVISKALLPSKPGHPPTLSQSKFAKV
jgi:hypothetical protein